MNVFRILKNVISNITSEALERKNRREPRSWYESMYYAYNDFLIDNRNNLLRKDRWNMLFNVLDKLRIHPDYELDDYRSKASNDNVLKLYARPANKPRPSEKDFVKWEYKNDPFSLFHSMCDIRKYGLPDKDFFEEEDCDEEEVIIDPHFPAAINPFDVICLNDAEESIWQALLLYMTSHFIGMRWHGGYNMRKLVFCKEDLPTIEGKKLDKFGPVPDLDECEFTPQVVKPSRDWRGKDGYVRFCWWNMWNGLERITLTYKHSFDHKTIKFGEYSCKNLYYYECGIRF